MNIHEYQAKEIFRRFGVPVADGGVAFFGPVAGLEKSSHPQIQEFLDLDKVQRV